MEHINRAEKITMASTYQRRKIGGENVDFHTESLVIFSDDIFGKMIHKDCPNIYVRDKGRFKRRFDSSDWKDVAARLFSQWQSKRKRITTSDLHEGLMEGKAEIWGFDQEKPVDSHSRISSRSSDSRKRASKESANARVPPRRRRMQGSRSSNQRVVSARSCSRTSVLRQPLYNTLFDHFFRNMWRESPKERRDQFTCVHSFWFDMYRLDHNREKVPSWIKKLNIFSKRFVFVPILMWSHWFLAIFCHFGESLESKTTTPCILLLDSLQTYGALPRVEPLIRRLVMDIFEAERRPESKDMVKRIHLLVPKVPQQRNDKECGIFVLYYISLFLERAPKCFSIFNGYPYFMKEEWFTEEELEGFYERLEYFGLESSDSEEGVESSDSEGFIFERVCKD